VARQGPPLRPLIAILVACGLLLAGVLPGVSAVLRGAGGQGDLCVAGNGSIPARSDGGGHTAHCVLCLTHAVGDTAPPPRADAVLRPAAAHAPLAEAMRRRHVAAPRWRVPPSRAPPPIAVAAVAARTV
jgi:hypothetical protein